MIRKIEAIYIYRTLTDWLKVEAEKGTTFYSMFVRVDLKGMIIISPKIHENVLGHWFVFPLCKVVELIPLSYIKWIFCFFFHNETDA